MKTVLAYLFLLIYLVQPIQLAGVVINFKINQAYIAKILCINKDKPELKCNGQCHLKKQLEKKTEEKEKAPLTIPIKEQIQIVESILSLNHIEYTNIDSISSKHINSNYHSDYVIDIFHPPTNLI